MAGAAYISNRPDKNAVPSPAGASMLLAPKHFGSSCKLEPA
jgi:hypothetical protein